MNAFWFRRDLRLDDNKALFEALTSSDEVLPLFIFDKNILNQLQNNDARVSFIYQLLQKINLQLADLGKSLATFYGNPEEVWKQILNENDIKKVYFNHDYEPYARDRDKQIYNLLQSKNIEIKNHKDQVIFEKNEVTKEDGLPYVVFTPYSKKWKENFKKTNLNFNNSEDNLNKIANHNYPFLNLSDIGFVKSEIEVANYDISSSLIQNYEQTRNFPALQKTSLLAPHLRFGSISIRKIIAKAKKESNETFLNELIWREFFMQILWHYPHTAKSSFRPKYDNIEWENDQILFKKWCEGNTGYPFVDAGMRELNATGHMHNRVRMIVASFLCKHLLIDWRWGETYFATKLLDYEQASNIGNWQWAAGCGVDAAPYFRIFNPTEQIKKFDKDLIYIKKWIPELNELSYSKPIVDHKNARERCLKAYKEALK
jgi:deoxyribodipyrimidine photo-lyase